MTQPIFLIRPRGCGKTTVGHALWRERGIFSSPIPIIGYRPMSSGRWLRSCRRKGWARFRELETLSLKAVTLPNTVIATGGGIVLAEGNRQFMRENGVVIYPAGLGVGAD